MKGATFEVVFGVVWDDEREAAEDNEISTTVAAPDATAAIRAVRCEYVGSTRAATDDNGNEIKGQVEHATDLIVCGVKQTGTVDLITADLAT